MQEQRDRAGRTLPALVAIAACVILGAGWSDADDEKKPAETAAPGWDYLTVPHYGDVTAASDLKRRIDQLGRDGWELVDVATYARPAQADKTIFFFKKRL